MNSANDAAPSLRQLQVKHRPRKAGNVRIKRVRLAASRYEYRLYLDAISTLYWWCSKPDRNEMEKQIRTDYAPRRVVFYT